MQRKVIAAAPVWGDEIDPRSDVGHIGFAAAARAMGASAECRTPSHEGDELLGRAPGRPGPSLVEVVSSAPPVVTPAFVRPCAEADADEAA